MAKVPYELKRNTSAGRPSVYCRASHYQTLTFDDICRSASHIVHVPPAMLRGYVQAVLDEAYLQVRRGQRVELGDRFLSLYAQVHHSEKAAEFREPATIDAVFNMLCWLVEKGYVNNKE